MLLASPTNTPIMKQLYVIHEGHRVAIDPVTGQIQARRKIA